MLMPNRSTRLIICLFFLHCLFGSVAAYDQLPHLYETTPDDFVCISGCVRDAVTQDPLAGVGVCIFPEGLPADSSACACVIHESGVEYQLPSLPGFRWLVYTDRSGRFSVCVIPARLVSHDFSAVVYKRGYVPQFPKEISPESGQKPVYGCAVSLIPSEQ